MGCFLAIGLRLTAAIRKKDIDHRQDGVTLEDVLGRVAHECHLGNKIFGEITQGGLPQKWHRHSTEMPMT